MIGKEIFFFYKAVIFGIAALTLIPKEYYKKYFVYGLLFGGVGDYITVFIMDKIFHLVKYQNMGIFNVANLVSFWTPLAWMFVFAFYLYMLPHRKAFLVIYILAFGFFGHAVGLTLQNIGLFKYMGNYVYFAPIAITSWFALAAWIFIRIEQIKIA